MQEAEEAPAEAGVLVVEVSAEEISVPVVMILGCSQGPNPEK